MWEFHIKKGRVNSDLPFLKTKELIFFEVLHRLHKINIPFLPVRPFAFYHEM